MQTVQALYLKHKEFLQILLLFAAFRIMTLVMYRPGGYVVDWNDYYFFKSWAQLTDLGKYPYLDFWMEHPPLFPWLVVLAYRLSILIPPWSDSNLIFSLVFGLILLPFEIGNLTLLYLIGKKFLDHNTVIKACWIYASLFVPVFFWTAGFDTYPLFFILLSIFFILRGNALLAGVSTGIGFMVKIIPILVTPAAIATFGALKPLQRDSDFPQTGFRALVSSLFSRKSMLYVILLAVTAGLIALPFVLANKIMFLASIQNMLNRASWESVWALLDGYYGGGGVAEPPTRLNPATAFEQRHLSSLPWLWITVGFTILYLFIWTRRINWRSPRGTFAFAGLTINIFLLYSKGYSPQFLVYVLPFIVLLMPSFKGIAYALLLSLLNMLEYPITVIILPDSHWLLTFTVLARTGILIALSLEFMSIAMERYNLARSRVLSFGLIVVISITGLIAFPSIVNDYVTTRLANNQYQDTLSFLRQQPSDTLLFTDVDVLRQFAPFVGSQDHVRLLDSPEKIKDIVTQGRSMWVVYLGTTRDKELNPQVEEYLSERAFPDNTVWFSNSRLTHYIVDDLPFNLTSAQFGKKIELLGYGLSSNSAPGNLLHVQLKWHPLEGIREDYKVFVHLIDEEGKLVAQQDGIPENGRKPTTGWAAGSDIIDNISVHIPSSLTNGLYSLRIGLYASQSGQRLLTDSGLDYAEIEDIRIQTR